MGVPGKHHGNSTVVAYLSRGPYFQFLIIIFPGLYWVLGVCITRLCKGQKRKLRSLDNYYETLHIYIFIVLSNEFICAGLSNLKITEH